MKPWTIHHGDALTVLRTMPEESVHCCVTSPPYYGLRDYGEPGQIGLEPTPAEFITRLMDVFREVRRVLRKDGTCWVNMGDSYAGSWGSQGRQGHGAIAGRSAVAARQIAAAAKKLHRTGAIPEASGLKPKDLMGIPWMLAFALRADGWYLRQDIIWHKPNPMPESVRDRCTKAHEYVFMLSKSQRYHFASDAISEVGSLLKSGNTRHKYVNGQPLNRTKSGFLEMRGKVYERVNRRSVWTLGSQPTPEAHFATYPIELPEMCIKAGCPEGGIVLDPFAGAGTTGLAALKNGRAFVGIELNREYIAIAEKRARDRMPLLLEASNAPAPIANNVSVSPPQTPPEDATKGAT